jgi:glycosyltransferase involved in cell wall biosynthesis
MPQLSIVLPCYNESRGIEAILNRFAEVGRGQDFELILVDNGSKDDTQATFARLLPRFPFARSVKVEVNQGYGHGIFTGLQSAQGEVVGWSHADLQTDPADVFRAWASYRAAATPERTMIKGRRYGRRLSEKLISLGMQALSTLVFRSYMQEINAQPKVFHRDLLSHLTRPPVDFNFDLYVLVMAKRHGWRIESIPVQFPPRKYGHSNWAATWRSKFRTIARSIRYMFSLALAGQ